MYCLLLCVLAAAHPVAPPYQRAIAAPYTGEIKLDAVVHTGQPITRPMRLRHTLRESGCTCPMCLGSHLVNAHGLTRADWDRLKLGTNHGTALRLHRDLHRQADPPVGSGCGPGGCPAPRRVFRGLFRW